MNKMNKLHICIPSYNRPDSSTIRKLYEQLPNEQVECLIFIRNSEKQRCMYSKYADRMKLIEIADVKNIGETRAKIVSYCIEHKLKSVFMLDDDMTMFSRTSLVGNKMKPIVVHSNLPRLNLESFVEAHRDIISIQKRHTRKIGVCGFIPYGFSWIPELNEEEFLELRKDSIQCVWLNIKGLYDHHINYKSSDEVGFEDQAIVLDILDSGMTQIVLTHYAFGVLQRNMSGGMAEYYLENTVHGMSDRIIKTYGRDKVILRKVKKIDKYLSRINYAHYRKVYGLEE